MADKATGWQYDQGAPAGSPFVHPTDGPRPGFLVGLCGHAVDEQRYQAGFIICEEACVVAAVARPHIRIRYSTNGAHTHCSVWSTEQGGPDVTHGRNGTLVFRNAEFEAFRKTIEVGMSLAIVSAIADVEFVEDPAEGGRGTVNDSWAPPAVLLQDGN